MRSGVRTVRMPEGHRKGLSNVKIASIGIAASETRLVISSTFFSYNRFSTVFTKSQEDKANIALQKG